MRSTRARPPAVNSRGRRRRARSLWQEEQAQCPQAPRYQAARRARKTQILRACSHAARGSQGFPGATTWQSSLPRSEAFIRSEEVESIIASLAADSRDADTPEGSREVANEERVHPYGAGADRAATRSARADEPVRRSPRARTASSSRARRLPPRSRTSAGEHGPENLPLHDLALVRARQDRASARRRDRHTRPDGRRARSRLRSPWLARRIRRHARNVPHGSAVRPSSRRHGDRRARARRQSDEKLEERSGHRFLDEHACSGETDLSRIVVLARCLSRGRLESQSANTRSGPCRRAPP